MNIFIHKVLQKKGLNLTDLFSFTFFNNHSVTVESFSHMHQNLTYYSASILMDWENKGWVEKHLINGHFVFKPTVKSQFLLKQYC